MTRDVDSDFGVIFKDLVEISKILVKIDVFGQLHGVGKRSDFQLFVFSVYIVVMFRIFAIALRLAV